jgi:hypothetical protein
MRDKCCYQCEERHPLCHSACKKYKDWKAKHDELQAAIRAEKDEAFKLDHQAFIARARIRKEKPPR